MCTYLKNMEGYKLKYLKSKGFDSIQEMIDRAFKRVNTFEDFRTDLVEGKEKRAGEELMQENAMKQKVEDDKETSELKQCLEIILDEEEVTIDVIPLAVKSPSIIQYREINKITKYWIGSSNDTCGVTFLEDPTCSIIHMLVGKKYPLKPSTTFNDVGKEAIKIDYEKEMALQLLQFIVK
ncbi:hypothetical protein Tco_0320001 [Tanacetum coccineum]